MNPENLPLGTKSYKKKKEKKHKSCIRKSNIAVQTTQATIANEKINQPST